MFAIVPLLLEKPWGKVSWGLLGATAFAMATYDFTLGAFMEYAQSIGALVAEVEVFDDHQINILRVLVYWVPALFALIFPQTTVQQLRQNRKSIREYEYGQCVYLDHRIGTRRKPLRQNGCIF